MRETLTSADKRWFRTCKPDAFGALHDYYIEQALEDGDIDMLVVVIESCKFCEDLDQGRVAASTSEVERCVEDYCHHSCVQVQM